jgi:hypothetical protein
VFASRRRPFATDEQPSPTDSDGEADRLWRLRVADAAGLAADALVDEDDPFARRLYEDLRELRARLTAEDDDRLPDPTDPRPTDAQR